MARTVVVRLKWEPGRTDPEGRGYAILRWMSDGKRLSRTLGYVSPAEADELRVQHEASLRLRVASPIDSSAAATVADVLAAYLQELERRPVTTGYAELELARCMRLRDRLGSLPAEALTMDQVAAYVGDRRREPSRHHAPPRRTSLLMEVDTLRRAYQVAARQGRVSPRVLMEVRPPKVADDKRPPRRLTEAEVSRLIRAGHEDLDDGFPSANDRTTDGLGWLIQVLAWSGRRPVAVFALEVADLSRLLDRATPPADQLVYWRRDKGGVSRGWGPVTEPARAALIARAQEVGAGRLWSIGSAKALHRPFHRVAAAAGIVDAQPYDLRRFAVTRIVQGVGGNLRTAMSFTGHTHVETLLRYLYADTSAATDLAPQIGWSAPRLVAEVVADDDERTSEADR